ncbi:aminodeoxychorismate synthase component I [Acidithiobacillus sp. IBUN Pt1247-S3]|uniref:aminodeoxychorismate synthase component I n=1 Tax=Acidithiobacillus sp. IBUN Pt1247-S3 TaxID=3166642 RepID=UPI0034E3922D
MQRQEVAYHRDGAEIFARFAAEPGAVFLDSGLASGPQRHFDLLLRHPRLWVWEDGNGVWCQRPDGLPELQDQALFPILRRVLGESLPVSPGELPQFPLVCGYLSYEWGMRHKLGGKGESTQPLALFALYDQGLAQDHRQQRAWIIGDSPAQESWHAVLASPPSASSFILQEPIANDWSYAEYAAAFAQVQEYIRAGDCYQINLTQTFTSSWLGDPWPLYARLRSVSRAPFSAFFRHPWGSLLSVSPERLLRLQDGQLEARPIKGTRARSEDPQQDRALAAELLASEKDQAENVMIVDLLRNDLGHVASTGSVRVPELFALESYDQVHHLVSSVVAELAPGFDAWDALGAAFPGGSITGAPKRRAMAIIAELEAHNRGLYCGSFGYVAAAGNMDWNILIRSLELDARGSLRFSGGGAVVADSDCASEYAESQEKVAMIRTVLEEFLPQGLGCARVTR